eukprot:TRINITY_DN2015_c0_g2_i6.p2 TRINITY_DN2015_c0_g2~~TRINITY_DN2015_c0_g2_i6.p2  ORF type:complete len:118 (-),score=11.75 TRINITY_DN2015_c0_g2_i6:730-1083(-)
MPPCCDCSQEYLTQVEVHEKGDIYHTVGVETQSLTIVENPRCKWEERDRLTMVFTLLESEGDSVLNREIMVDHWRLTQETQSRIEILQSSSQDSFFPPHNVELTFDLIPFINQSNSY